MKNRAYAAAILAFSTALISGSVRAEPVVVQYQSSNLGESQFEPVWRASIAEFEAANPDIKIEPVIVPRKDAWTKFVTAAQAHQAPCIAAVDATTAAANGYLMPLDKFWNAEP